MDTVHIDSLVYFSFRASTLGVHCDYNFQLIAHGHRKMIWLEGKRADPILPHSFGAHVGSQYKHTVNISTYTSSSAVLTSTGSCMSHTPTFWVLQQVTKARISDSIDTTKCSCSGSVA